MIGKQGGLMNQEETYKFKATIQNERYYSEETNWGCYAFITRDEIPNCKEYSDPFLDDVESVGLRYGMIAGKLQKLYIGAEYEIHARQEYNSKYKSWQFAPTIVSAIVPKNTDEQRKFLESIITKNQAEVLTEAYPNIVEDVINGLKTIDYNKTKGIKEYTWNQIVEKIIENYLISDILILLQPLGVTFTMMKKLIKNEPNPELLKQKLLDDPYILTISYRW